MVNTSFSDQVFQQLQIKPIINLDPTTTTSSNLSLNQLRPSIYDQDYHLPSLPTSPLKLSNSPIRSALRPTPPLSSARQHKSPSLHPRSPRSRTGSSGACSDLSVRFSSVSSLRSTQPHSPPTPDKRQTYRTLALIPPPIPPSLPPTRSTSALSRASFRSISSIGSRLRAKLTPSSSSQSKPPCELSWANLRAEYELHLARGSLIERCLVDVSLNPDEHPTIAKRWTDRVWKLADRLSPSLPAAMFQYPADGLLPLLIPLRVSLDQLSNQVPFQGSRRQLCHLEHTLARAHALAGLIEGVIEVVGRAGLIRFELVGLVPASTLDDDADDDDQEAVSARIARWSGEMKGKTGSGSNWRGFIRRVR